MKKANFIISYDISDERRLRKISKLVEKSSLRIQLSIYYCPDFTFLELSSLVKKIVEIMDENEDDFRIYKIKKGAISFMSAIDLDNYELYIKD